MFTNAYKVRTLCKILKISRSGYYKHISKVKSKHDIENEILSEYIKRIFTDHKSRYGVRRIKVVLLNDYSHTTSLKK